MAERLGFEPVDTLALAALEKAGVEFTDGKRPGGAA
jgi:hypothetical protein